MEPLRVLVVERSPEIARLMQDALSDYACETTISLDAAAALLLAKDVNPDVVVSDFPVDGLEGRVFFASLREMGIGCPIVLCSGWNEAIEVAEEFGMPFIPKPFDLDDFITTVTSFRDGERRV